MWRRMRKFPLNVSFKKQQQQQCHLVIYGSFLPDFAESFMEFLIIFVSHKLIV